MTWWLARAAGGHQCGLFEMPVTVWSGDGAGGLVSMTVCDASPSSIVMRRDVCRCASRHVR